MPLLPISGQGSTPNDFIVSVKYNAREQIILSIKGIDFVISVTSNSMTPE